MAALPTLLLDIGFNNDFQLTPTHDITADLISFHISRGRTHELDKIEAGTAEFLLKNHHGNYWPGNTASPYYPNIRPGRIVTLSAVGSGYSGYLYTGFVEAWEPGWLSDKGGLVPTMTLRCVDLTKQLARFMLNEAGYASEKSGVRVGNVLDSFGWPAGPRNIDTGLYDLLATGALINQVAMDHLFSLQESEGGLFFIAPNGDTTYQAGNARTDSVNHPTFVTSQATLSDNIASGESPYILPELSMDDQYIYNEIRAQRIEGVVQVATDGLSQAIYGPRTLTKQSLILANDSDVLTRSNYLLSRFRESSMRVKSLKLLPQGNALLFPLVVEFDISTKITFKLGANTSGVNPAEISKDYHIEGIEHDFDFRTGKWQTSWQLSDSDTEVVISADITHGHCGYIMYEAAANYATVRANATGTPYNDPATVSIGQAVSAGPTNQIRRGGITFDTSGIEDTAVIASAEIWLYGSAIATPQRSLRLQLVDGEWLGDVLVDWDYGDLVNEVADYGSILLNPGASDNAWTDAGWNRIPLTALGLAEIDKTGTTRFGLRSTRDIDNEDPAGLGNGLELINFDGSGGTNPPLLVVRLAK